MTYLEHHTPMMAIRPLNSPNEFYDSAIELLADDYSCCDHPYLPSTKTNNHSDHFVVTSSSNRLVNFAHLSLDDYHQSYNSTVHHSMLNRSKLNGNELSKKTIPALLDQIDASSSTLDSSKSEIIPRQQRQQHFNMSMKHHQVSSDNQCQPSTSSLATVLKEQVQQSRMVLATLKKQNQQQHQPQSASIQKQQQVVLTSSPLRSSRSFTASYCPRPNVTLTRRKSASERLAESKSKYIRRIPSSTSDDIKKAITDQEPDQFQELDVIDPSNNNKQIYPYHHYHQIQNKLIGETTSSSTKSSFTNSSSNHSLSFQNSSPIVADCYDHLNSMKTTCCSDNNHSLVSKINIHLNKVKQNNNIYLVKKRVSPKLSENSTSGTSILELQLRELISLDNTVGDVKPNMKTNEQFHPIKEACSASSNQQQQPIDRDIYRAELKYIGSSSSSSSSSISSSCSIFSEPYNISSSPEKMKRTNEESTNINKFSNYPPDLPSMDCENEQNCNNNNLSSSVIRSKSDLSCPFEKSSTRFLKSNTAEGIGRLLESLCLDSNQMNDENGIHETAAKKQLVFSGDMQSSKLMPNCRNFSCSSIDSLEKINSNNDNNKSNNRSRKKILYFGYNLSTTKSSTNDFFSLNSSTQLSVDSHSFTNHKIHNHHSGSTSKLTFENLMLHQQNLASSRSCTNLIANFHNGPSVVERNARIIKWLFNCRKAMDQQSTLI